MGGEHSGVTEATTDIVIECAYFDPEHIALTGQKLGLVSDARSRFERGVDPAFLEPGLELATAMAIELAGGEPSQIVRAGTPPRPDKVVDYDPARCAGLGRGRRARRPAAGHPPAARLHSDARATSGGSRCRRWRRDVDGAADLVEEVARIDGYDKVPSTPLPRAPGVARPTATPEQLVERQRAAGGGGARAQRGGDLELHLRGRGGAVRRRRLAARQPDQRGDEGDAALAPPRPARRGGAQHGARRGERSGCSRSAGAISRTAERPTLGLVLAGPRGAQALARQGRRASTPMTPRRRRWRSSPPPARRSTICRCSAMPRPSTIPASRDGSASARRPCSPSSARSTPGWRRRSTSTARSPRPRSSSTPSRQKRGAAGHMRSAYAPPPLQAVKRDFAFLVPAELPADELLRAVRGADKAAIVGGEPVRRLHRSPASPRGASRSPSK